MPGFSVLQLAWKERLANLLHSAKAELLISSPYVTREGTDFVADNVSSDIRRRGHINVLTDLSPLNICQGSTDPNALQCLATTAPKFTAWHLPRLHAKVYIADVDRAIVTSGNLTAAGLTRNYEYGVEIADPQTVEAIRYDFTAYADLGASVSSDRLITYCRIADRVREAFRKEQAAVAKSAHREFERALRGAEDELIRLRLAGGAVNTVFVKTILYLLARYGPLRTENLHFMIEAIHPDLCDNSVDRVIDGKRFGKKWKHAVRTAQQHLKKKGFVALTGGRWILLEQSKS